MRRDVSELKSFYATPLGQAARDTILRQVAQAWGSLRMLDVLGVGDGLGFDCLHLARRGHRARPFRFQ